LKQENILVHEIVKQRLGKAMPPYDFGKTEYVPQASAKQLFLMCVIQLEELSADPRQIQ
jgi:hypothetical protein